MILDYFNMLCESDSIKSISSSASYIGDILDLSGGLPTDAWGTAITPDKGEGTTLYWVVQCEDTDFASSGSPVITIDLHTSNSYSTSDLSGTISTLATMVTDKTPNDGDIIGAIPLPKGTIKRYLQVNVASASGELTAGKITSFLTTNPPTQQYDA